MLGNSVTEDRIKVQDKSYFPDDTRQRCNVAK